MLGIIDPAKLETLVHTILSKDEKGVLNFLKEASEYEAEMILDELTLYLKTLLLERQSLLSPLIIERFFRIIAESKSLLALGSDNEFVLSLTLFKMLEAQQLKEIDTLIKRLEGDIETISSSISTSVSENQTTPHPSPVSKEPEVITISQEEIEPDSIPQSIEVTTTPVQTHKEEKTPEKKRFDTLLARIYDRDYELGELFERHISFVSFENQTLRWESTAEGEDKKALIQAWGVIKLLVEETFGENTVIDNIAKKKAPLTAESSAPPHSDSDSASMIEEVEVKSSCIAPEAGDTEAAKEKDPSELLEEPMVKAAIDLFNPKKVRIKRNV
jgi:DNA polymerase-3 subunit gamma/tau